VTTITLILNIAKTPAHWHYISTSTKITTKYNIPNYDTANWL